MTKKSLQQVLISKLNSPVEVNMLAANFSVVLSVVSGEGFYICTEACNHLRKQIYMHFFYHRKSKQQSFKAAGTKHKPRNRKLLFIARNLLKPQIQINRQNPFIAQPCYCCHYCNVSKGLLHRQLLVQHFSGYVRPQLLTSALVFSRRSAMSANRASLSSNTAEADT